MYGFVDNRGPGWIDDLGHEMKDIDNLTRPELEAAVGEGTRQRARERARGNMSTYDNLLRDHLKNSKIGNKINTATLTIKEVTKAEKCDCGKVSIRIGVTAGGSDSDFNFNNKNPWLELSFDPTKPAKVDRSKTDWDIRIERGPNTCKLLTIQAEASADPDDAKWFSENPGAPRPHFGDSQHKEDWDDKKPFQRIAGPNGASHLSPFQQVRYKDTNGNLKISWVRIKIVGKDESDPTKCCVAFSWIK